MMFLFTVLGLEEYNLMGQFAKLILVSVDDGHTKQSNKYYNMTELDDDTFEAEWGRVDVTSAKKIYPMDKWDNTLKSKVKKGYTDISHLHAEVSEESSDGKVVAIVNTAVNSLMTTLQGYANNSIKQNYTISSKAVTQQMINEAQEVVDSLADVAGIGMDIDDRDIKGLNDSLLQLYHIIPRRMHNVKEHLVEDVKKVTTDILTAIQKQVADEQATLDVMAGQVSLQTTKDDTKTKKDDRNLLDLLGIELTNADASDVKKVEKLMGPNAHQVKKVFCVKHLKTQSKFDKHLVEVKDGTTEYFFHGSRNQNWLNILSTGLLIRPSGAIHNGSMFGDGIYFADKAQKSIGYTSLRGSYWTGGGENKAYLALFEVHIGSQKHIKRHTSSCYQLDAMSLMKDGFDSVFAHGGADLRNNEYIVYMSQQCTVTHLIEIGS